MNTEESKARWDKFAREQQVLAARFKEKPMIFQPTPANWARKNRTPRLGKAVGRQLRHEYRKLYVRCYWCGSSFVSIPSTLDHLIPLAKKGSNRPENIVLACVHCNTWKGDTDPYAFLPRNAPMIQQIITRLHEVSLDVDALTTFPRGAVISVLWQHFKIKLPHGYPEEQPSLPATLS